MKTDFIKLNRNWNADPNGPEPQVAVIGPDLCLSFDLNTVQFPQFKEGDLGQLRFKNCWRYRLAPPNDEGWMRGQCRFGAIPREWG